MDQPTTQQPVERQVEVPHTPLLAERITALAVGILIVLTGLFLVVRNEPFTDPNLVVIMRVFLSMAMAVFGAVLPGVLGVVWSFKGVTIRATGALALFVITFFGTPKVFLSLDDGLRGLQGSLDRLTAAIQRLQDNLATKSPTEKDRAEIREAFQHANKLKAEWDAALKEYNEIPGSPLSILSKQRHRSKLMNLSAQMETAALSLDKIALDLETSPKSQSGDSPPIFNAVSPTNNAVSPTNNAASPTNRAPTNNAVSPTNAPPTPSNFRVISQ